MTWSDPSTTSVVSAGSLFPDMGLAIESTADPEDASPDACQPPVAHHLLAPGIGVVCENGLDTLARLPARSVRLIVIDPPYGFFPHSHGRHHWSWDKQWPDTFWQSLMVQIRRVLAKNGRLLVFSVRDFSDHVSRMVRPQVYGSDLGFQRLLWHHGEKTNCQNPHMLMQDYEEMLVYSRKCDKEHLKKPSATRNTQLTTFNVRRDPLDSGGDRPTMKPLRLMESLIENMTDPDDLVVDVTANNHVTGRAAYLHGRKYIGVEIDPSRFDNGVRLMREFLPTASRKILDDAIQHASLDRSEAIQLCRSLNAGIAAARERSSLTLTLEGREYRFYGWDGFKQVRAHSHDATAQAKHTILIYRGERGLLGLLRRALPGFDAICTLAEKTCPGLRVGFVHGLRQGCAQACLDWHADSDTQGYRRVQKTMVTCLTDTETHLDVEVLPGVVQTFPYQGEGSTLIFDAGLRHRSGPASAGTLKVALMMVPCADASEARTAATSKPKRPQMSAVYTHMSVTRSLDATGTRRRGPPRPLRRPCCTSMATQRTQARGVTPSHSARQPSRRFGLPCRPPPAPTRKMRNTCGALM